MALTLKINGALREVDVDGDIPLFVGASRRTRNDRDQIRAVAGRCAVLCTVHLDGQPVRSRQTPLDSVGESAITTIEAIGEAPQGTALQRGVVGPRGGPVWLLPVRSDHVCGRTVEGHSEADR